MGGIWHEKSDFVPFFTRRHCWEIWVLLPYLECLGIFFDRFRFSWNVQTLKIKLIFLLFLLISDILEFYSQTFKFSLHLSEISLSRVQHTISLFKLKIAVDSYVCNGKKCTIASQRAKWTNKSYWIIPQNPAQNSTKTIIAF